MHIALAEGSSQQKNRLSAQAARCLKTPKGMVQIVKLLKEGGKWVEKVSSVMMLICLNTPSVSRWKWEETEIQVVNWCRSDHLAIGGKWEENDTAVVTFFVQARSLESVASGRAMLGTTLTRWCDCHAPQFSDGPMVFYF